MKQIQTWPLEGKYLFSFIIVITYFLGALQNSMYSTLFYLKNVGLVANDRY